MSGSMPALDLFGRPPIPPQQNLDGVCSVTVAGLGTRATSAPGPPTFADILRPDFNKSSEYL
jgi:hypothetical protein